MLRGTKSAITTENPVLLAGQPCVELDTGQMKVGNGTTAYNSLPYVGGTGASVLYGSSSTAAGTAAKVATIANYKLTTGALVLIEFTATNTASNPTLNISSTGAKAIYYNGAAVTASYLKAQHIYMMRYNGTQYDIVGDIDSLVEDAEELAEEVPEYTVSSARPVQAEPYTPPKSDGGFEDEDGYSAPPAQQPMITKHRTAEDIEKELKKREQELNGRFVKESYEQTKYDNIVVCPHCGKQFKVRGLK